MNGSMSSNVGVDSDHQERREWGMILALSRGGYQKGFQSLPTTECFGGSGKSWRHTREGMVGTCGKVHTWTRKGS